MPQCYPRYALGQYRTSPRTHAADRQGPTGQRSIESVSYWRAAACCYEGLPYRLSVPDIA
eukprot:2735629-Rhodomonas_salina.4